MRTFKILMSNLGYARGISGSLRDHLRYAHRHFYCSPEIQKRSLRQLGRLIAEEDPDICCFMEIDKGSMTSAGINQLQELVDEKYRYFDIESKYAEKSRLKSFVISRGKSNAFLAKHNFLHEKLYFSSGLKRLIYKIILRHNFTLFFAHFSLNRSMRARQILETRRLIMETEGDVIFMGDFNILSGFKELDPLLESGRFMLLNQKEVATFTLHKRRLVLDLCICSADLAHRAHLKIVPQPYSDHAALVLAVSSA